MGMYWKPLIAKVLLVALFLNSCALPGEDSTDVAALRGPRQVKLDPSLGKIPLGTPKYLFLGDQRTACIDACIITGPSAFWLGTLAVAAVASTVGSAWYIYNEANKNEVFGPFESEEAAFIRMAQAYDTLPIEQVRAREKERVERRRRKRKVVFHYTNLAAALAISASASGKVTDAYRGSLANHTRPPGFYATALPPWVGTTSQKQLSELFYGGNQGRDLSWFVAVEGSEFIAPYGAPSELYKPGKQGGFVKLEVITIGPNLMPK